MEMGISVARDLLISTLREELKYPIYREPLLEPQGRSGTLKTSFTRAALKHVRSIYLRPAIVLLVPNSV